MLELCYVDTFSDAQPIRAAGISGFVGFFIGSRISGNINGGIVCGSVAAFTGFVAYNTTTLVGQYAIEYENE